MSDKSLPVWYVYPIINTNCTVARRRDESDPFAKLAPRQLSDEKLQKYHFDVKTKVLMVY